MTASFMILIWRPTTSREHHTTSFFIVQLPFSKKYYSANGLVLPQMKLGETRSDGNDLLVLVLTVPLRFPVISRVGVR